MKLIIAPTLYLLDLKRQFSFSNNNWQIIPNFILLIKIRLTAHCSLLTAHYSQSLTLILRNRSPDPHSFSALTLFLASTRGLAL